MPQELLWREESDNRILQILRDRGLSEWRTEKGLLIDICLEGQETFVRLLEMLGIQATKHNKNT